MKERNMRRMRNGAIVTALAVTVLGVLLLRQGTLPERGFDFLHSNPADEGGDVATALPPSVSGSSADGEYRLAPDFERVTMEGSTVRLAAQRGHVVVLNFWATWCAPCRIRQRFVGLVDEETLHPILESLLREADMTDRRE